MTARSSRRVCGPLAQLVEQGTFNPKAAGSIPSRPTTDFSKDGVLPPFSYWAMV